MALQIDGRLGYAVVDGDEHYYESDDAFTRHIEDRFRDNAINVVVGEDGLGRVHLGTRPLPWRPITQCDQIGPPGANVGFIKGEPGFVQPAPIRPREDLPASMDRDVRLRLMDEQGVAAAIFIPSLGTCVEWELYKEGPEVAFANLRAFNRWLYEEWGFSFENRIFGVPMLSLADVDLAVSELTNVLELGARVVHLNPGPAYGRSPADPHFDPFWARLQEAGVPVIYHVSHSGYNEMIGRYWGEPADVTVFEQTPLQNFLGLADRPIADTIAALVLGGLFGRFPDLRVMSIENGSAWVEPLLHAMDHAAQEARQVPPGGTPSEQFKSHVYVSPYWEEDVPKLTELLGIDHVLFGSDFPHPEGTAKPVDFVDSLEGLDEHAVRRIMRDNTAELLGLQPSELSGAR